jgi:fucose permease
VVAAAQLALAAAYWLTRQRYTVRSPDHWMEAPRATSPSSRLVHSPLLWLSLALFFVYAGMEAGAGQWSFSLFTLSRAMPAALAGALVSAYWASLTLGRVVFGALVHRISSERVLSGCMLACILAAGVLSVNIPVVSGVALAVMGLAFAPIFPILIAETPMRQGHVHAANAIGLQVAAAVAGGAAVPALLGVLSARVSLEVIGPALVVGGLVQFVLYEVLRRRAPRG